MSKSAKLAAVGIVFLVAAFGLLQSALAQLSSRVVVTAFRQGGGDGLFIMYGMAFMGLSVVAAVIAVLIAKDSED